MAKQPEMYVPNGPPGPFTEEKKPLEVVSSVETIAPCKRKLGIEIPAEEVIKALQASIGELRKQAILPGFRKGHAPLALIEKRFGRDLRREVKANLVVDGYRKALEDQKLEPIADPDLDLDGIEFAEDRPLKYELTVEVWPDFELKPEYYEGLKLEKPSSAPTDAEIDAEIQALRMRTTALEEIKDAGALESDYLICDYTVTSGDKEVMSAKDALVRPEDSTVGRVKVPGARDALVDKKAGDTVNLTFTIDSEYHQEEFRGKEASLAVNVKGVRRARVPEATDEWAKELGFESLSELRTVVSRNVEAGKESNADFALRKQIYDKLAEVLKFDLPEDAVRRQQKAVFRQERQGLQYRGATEEDLVKINDKLEEASLEKAQHDLKLFFILSKIAEKEGITAGEADIEMRVAELAARYRMTVAKMREHLRKEEMLAQIALEIREEKTVAHILSKAEIAQAVDAPAETPKASKKPRVKKGDTETEAESGGQ